MARSYVEAEAVARPAPDVVWELAGDAKQVLRVGAVEREGAHGRGAQAAGGAARTHAAERGANARGRALRERTRPSAARTLRFIPLRRAPSLSDLKGSQMSTSTGLAATAYQELAAAPRAAVITMGGPGHVGASWPVSRQC